MVNLKGERSTRRSLFVTTRGVAYEAGSPYEGWDDQEPVLRYPFQFMGVTDIQFIHVNGLDLCEAIRSEALDQAASKIKHLAAIW
jgi:FMN-dependent NADH-azoreductase